MSDFVFVIDGIIIIFFLTVIYVVLEQIKVLLQEIISRMF